MKVYIIYRKEDISNYEPSVWVYTDEKIAKEDLQELENDYGANSFGFIEEKIITLKYDDYINY